MSGWTGSRRDVRYELVEVAWPGLADGDAVAGLTGGRVDWSALTELKESATLAIDGARPASARAVRLWYSFTDDAGAAHREAVGTWLASVTRPVLSPGRARGELVCASVLSAAARRRVGAPYAVAAGVRAVERASELLRACGLTVVADPSAYALSTPRAYEAGTSHLAIANDLLAAASFSSARPDAMGRVRLEAYVEPTDRAPALVLASDGASMGPEVSCEDDGPTDNVCRLHLAGAEEELWAEARNDDPASPWSTVRAPGGESTLYEEVSEVAGATQAERVSALKALAARRLRDASALVERRTVTRPWSPLAMGDAVEIYYPEAGVSWAGAVVEASLPLTAASQCATTARRFVRPTFAVTTRGGAL